MLPKVTKRNNTSAAPSAPPPPMSKALTFQLEQQKALRCDYVLVKIGPDQKPRTCPFRLNHHVFMQMSFAALRDRCVAQREPQDVAALHCFLARFLFAQASFHQRKMMTGGAAAPQAQPKQKSRLGPANPQIVRGGPPPLSGTAGVSTQPKPERIEPPIVKEETQVPQHSQPPVVPVMNAEDLRLQLRAEYGIDVKDVVVAQQSQQRPGASGQLMPHELTEEEFMNQIAKPSSMAQECVIQ